VRSTTAEEEHQTPPSMLDPMVERPLPAWMDIELEDAGSGEVFRIRDLVGTPILLETFAVWCPICLRQQREIAKLAEIAGDQIL
jgi:hypothetical protein